MTIPTGAPAAADGLAEAVADDVAAGSDGEGVVGLVAVGLTPGVAVGAGVTAAGVVADAVVVVGEPVGGAVEVGLVVDEQPAMTATTIRIAPKRFDSALTADMVAHESRW